VAGERPFFSVCIPCFNHGRYIGATIQSVLDQDFGDFEIVVADNASTDDSRDVVRSFKDSRIRLIENRFNIGFAPNLQRVTEPARGRYLNLLSSDDVMEPGALRVYHDLIRTHQADGRHLVLMSQAWEIDETGRRLRYIVNSPVRSAPVRVRLPSREAIEAQPFHQVLRGRDLFQSCMRFLNTAGMFCTVVYARELWEMVEGYNSIQPFGPDMQFIIKVLKQDPTVIWVNRPLYGYRQHGMGQAGQDTRGQGLKWQMDANTHLLQYDDEWLRGTGVTRVHQQRVFVDRDCLKFALAQLALGRWGYASRLLAFAWATYPDPVLRNPKTWLLVVLLALGPLGSLGARAARRLYRAGRPDLPSLEDVVGRPDAPAVSASDR
jgi:glycosyltransferase involved in cell wall biosynthesis